MEQTEKIESVSSLRYKCLFYGSKWKETYGISLMFHCTEKRVKEAIKTLINHKLAEKAEGVFPSPSGRLTAGILRESIEKTKSKHFVYREKEGLLLLIDSRERNRRDNRFFFSNFLSEAGIPLESRMLPAGDFLWVHLKETREIYMELIIERKKIEDLLSSLRDGRYRAQKEKLLLFPGKKIYLVEGEERVCAPPVIKSYFTLSFSLIFQGFLLVSTQSIEKTLFFLSETTEFLTENLERSNTSVLMEKLPLSSLLPRISLKPSFSSQEKLISLLCGIKGVSYKTAEALSLSFSSLRELIKQLERKEELLKRISNIPLEKKTIGRKRASLIIRALSSY